MRIKDIVLSQLTEEINIPAPFLAKTLQELTKRTLISPRKGRNGGFYLTDDNRANTIITVVDAIDGLDKFQSCSLGLPVCGNENPCPIHHVISPLKSKLIEELSQKTIADYAKELKKGKTHII